MAALAAPEAEAYYGGYGLGYGLGVASGNALVGPSGISPAWPTTRGYGIQSTCYGCRGYGKRSADAEPEADAYIGYGNLGYAGLGYAGGLGYGYGGAVGYAGAGYSGAGYAGALGYGGALTYASAPVAAIAPVAAPVAAIAPISYGYGLPHASGVVANNNLWSGHTGNSYATALPGRSFMQVTRLHKREAEAEADAYYGNGYSASYGYGRLSYGLGVARYPGVATSYEARSPQGLSARGYGLGLGHGGYGLGYGRSSLGYGGYGLGYGRSSLGYGGYGSPYYG